MTGAAAQAPIFSRGSNVLEYWLLHAEGLVVRPLGARVEEVIAPAPFDRAETLIVRTRMRHRRIAIPARAVTAVEPAAGVLLLDRHAAASRRREPAWKLFPVMSAKQFRPSSSCLGGVRGGRARVRSVSQLWLRTAPPSELGGLRRASLP